MNDYQTQINQELYKLKKDRINNFNELKAVQKKIAYALQNDMGKDITEVLSGKKIVKLSFIERMRYKLRYIIDKIFNTF